MAPLVKNMTKHELIAEVHRLRQVIKKHQRSVSELGLNVNAKGEQVWGSQYDADLWAEIGLPDRPET